MRKSNLELYRVLCAYLVVIDHLIQHSGDGFWAVLNKQFSLNVSTSIILGSYGQVGVTGFIILSSWFLIEKDRIKYKSLLNIIGETILNGLIVLLLVFFVNPNWVGVNDFIQTVLSPFNGDYWFISTYILWILSFPLLLKLCINLPMREIKYIIIIMGLIVSVDQFLFLGLLSNLSYFVWITFLTYYFKNNVELLNKYKGIMFFSGITIMYIALFLSKIVMGTVYKRIFGTDTILTATIALGLFGFFLSINLKPSKIINWLGSQSLAVYVLHENTILTGRGATAKDIIILENYILKLDIMCDSPFWGGYLLICGIVIFILCAIMGTVTKKVISYIVNCCK